MRVRIDKERLINALYQKSILNWSNVLFPDFIEVDAEPATPTQSGQVLCNTSCPNDGCKLHASTQSGECCIKCDDERAVRNGGIPVNNCGHCLCHAPKEEGEETPNCNGCGKPFLNHHIVTHVQGRPGFFHTQCIPEPPQKVEEKPLCDNRTVEKLPNQSRMGWTPESYDFEYKINELVERVNWLLSHHTGEEGK